MNFEWVNQHYGANACIGRRVIAYGAPGTIVKDMGNHIGIVLDRAQEREPAPYHPIDGIVYGDVIEYKPPKVSLSTQRYREYWHSESTLSFAEWLGIDVPEREYGYHWDNRGKVRMRSSQVSGEFCKTLKEAKASYKQALKAYKERQKFLEAIDG